MFQNVNYKVYIAVNNNKLRPTNLTKLVNPMNHENKECYQSHAVTQANKSSSSGSTSIAPLVSI